jgi:hypothetical protein
MSGVRHLASSARIAALAFAVASGPVSAADFFISGQWNMNRGPTVNIPPGQPEVICHTGPGTVMAPCVRHQIFNGPLRGLKPGFGPDGAQSITGVGLASPGAAVRVPAGLMQLTGMSVAPVPLDVAVNQLDTSFMFFAPKTARTPIRPNITPVGIGPNQHPATANTRLMHQNAWMDAGQNARAGANFVVSWINPNNRFAAHPVAGQTVFNATSPLPFSRRVSYTANANAFGGTMGMMLSGFARVWVAVPVTPDAGVELIRSPVSGMGTQHPGRGYFTTATRVAPPGIVYNGVVQNPPCTTVNVPPLDLTCELVVSRIGPVVLNLPGATTINFGFPWTTGRVVVQADWVQGANPRVTTLSAEGGDTVDGGGVRHINLVSGGNALRNSVASGFGRTVHVDQVTINLPEPGVAMALGGSLGLVGVLCAVRKRLFA